MDNKKTLGVVVAVIILIGAGAFYYSNRSKAPEEKAETSEKAMVSDKATEEKAETSEKAMVSDKAPEEKAETSEKSAVEVKAPEKKVEMPEKAAVEVKAPEEKVEMPEKAMVEDKDAMTAIWKTYTNEKYQYEIKYPADWKQVGDEPEFNAPDYEVSAAKVTVEVDPDKKTLAASIDFLGLYEGVGASIIDSSAATFAGNPGHKIVFTIEDGNEIFKIMQILTSKNNAEHALIYEALEEKYNDHLKTAQEMIDSFKFK